MICERCGCSENDACWDDLSGPCGWSEDRPGWCTECAGDPQRFLVFYERNDLGQIAARYDFPREGEVAALVGGMFAGAAKICVGPMSDASFYDEEYMFASLGIGLEALARWDDPDAEPEDWTRHKPSDRRRPNGDPALEEVRP